VFATIVDKYDRRIQRLMQLIKQTSKHIVFIREECGKLSANKIKRFSSTLHQLNPRLCWQLIIVVRNPKYLALQEPRVTIVYTPPKKTHWTRPDVLWEDIFSMHSCNPKKNQHKSINE